MKWCGCKKKKSKTTTPGLVLVQKQKVMVNQKGMKRIGSHMVKQATDNSDEEIDDGSRRDVR